MKDSRIGSYGAVGVIMMLGLKWVILVSLPRAAFPVIVIGAHMVSRWCATGLIWRLRYVRTDADAKSKSMANGLGTANWLLSGALGALALLPVLLLIDPAVRPRAAFAVLIALATSMASALAAGAYFRARIGGYTGDCLGAAQQLAELSFLFAALFVATR